MASFSVVLILLFGFASSKLDTLFASSDADLEEQRQQQEYNAVPSSDDFEMEQGAEGTLAKRSIEEQGQGTHQENSATSKEIEESNRNRSLIFNTCH